MATTVDFIEYVCQQLAGIGSVRYRKMFGEYMVYVNDKPVLLVCNNNVFVKQLDCIKDLMVNAEIDKPYDGAREHYILEIDNTDLAKRVATEVEKVTPLPKRKLKNK